MWFAFRYSHSLPFAFGSSVKHLWSVVRGTTSDVSPGMIGTDTDQNVGVTGGSGVCSAGPSRSGSLSSTTGGATGLGLKSLGTVATDLRREHKIGRRASQCTMYFYSLSNSGTLAYS